MHVLNTIWNPLYDVWICSSAHTC